MLVAQTSQLNRVGKMNYDYLIFTVNTIKREVTSTRFLSLLPSPKLNIKLKLSQFRLTSLLHSSVCSMKFLKPHFDCLNISTEIKFY